MSKIVFVPQEKQRLVISCPYDEILYGGAAGGGKSFCLLMDNATHVLRAEGEGKKSNGVIFRRTYKELDQLVDKSHDIFPLLDWKFSKDKLCWTSPNGSKTFFSYLDSKEDARGHAGFEYDYEGFDELTLWATDEEYTFLGTRLRSASGVRVRRVSTTNPGNAGHHWVLKRWCIDEHPNGHYPIQETVTLKDGREITKTRIFIPAKLKDNRYLYESGEYEADLLTKPEHLRKMLLDGRWDVVEGQFFTEWNPDVHVIRPFKLDPSWKRWMGADWGLSHPYCFLWFCQSPDGTIYLYRELYGAGEGNNKGTFESPGDVADRVREIEMLSEEHVQERYMDIQAFDGETTEGQVTVADAFARKGIVFQKAIKHKKVASIAIARDWLKIVNGRSRFKVFSSCFNFVRTIPSLTFDERMPEQYQTGGENHAADAWMYACRRNMPDPEEYERSARLDAFNRRRMARFGAYGAQ